MSYDAQARRDTPLALKLKQQIRRDGPLTIGGYVEACLRDPEFGYYRRQAAIGAAADFITAPEISQTFGELIGLWCVMVWQQMGEPAAFNLIEFGPGRGTLMRDALRAMRLRPAVLAAARVHLIDTSAALIAQQRLALADAGVPVSWPDQPPRTGAPDVPAIVIANEFLDTAPVEQFVRTADGWVLRRVGLDEADRLIFVVDGACPVDTGSELDRRFATARPGDICERATVDASLRDALHRQSSTVAALLIDYGHGHSQPGDSLQAVRRHAHEHPLTSPGEADVTAQVDFQQVTDALADHCFVADGPVPQGEFLGGLGIVERASRLMAANPAKAGSIESGVARLLAPDGMGSRFKVLGIRSATLPRLPGFESRPTSEFRR
jgi:NADH dehydrogenase [ubiquinone] 1 alpha subcomplex assembly factor 7